MYCPNCGLANAGGVKFCANCGTALGTGAAAPPPSQGPYRMAPPVTANSMAKNVGIGCLVAVLIVLFIGVSCTRACFGRRHSNYIIRRR